MIEKSVAFVVNLLLAKDVMYVAIVGGGNNGGD